MIKNKYKLVSMGQVEDGMQIVIDQVLKGKPSYHKTEVVKLMKTLYNAMLSQANQNARVGIYIEVNDDDLELN